LDFILPGGLDPVAISANGSDPLGAGKACVGYLPQTRYDTNLEAPRLSS
jgi:hypothetical protein